MVPYVHISNIELHLPYIIENGEWNFKILYTQLPTFYKECIHNIILDTDTDEKLIWRSSPDGTYSASHACNARFELFYLFNYLIEFRVFLNNLFDLWWCVLFLCYVLVF